MSIFKSSPVMRLIGNIHYTYKFTIISIIFGIAILLSIYFLVEAQSEILRTTQLELKANRYKQHAIRVLEDVIKHQEIASAYLTGNTTMKSELISLESQINNNFRSLTSLDSDMERILATMTSDFQRRDLPNVKPSELERNWTSLSRQIYDSSKDESDRQHAELISRIKQLVTYVGDVSSITIQSDEKTYYLIASILNVLPEAQVLIPEINVTVRSAADAEAGAVDTAALLQQTTLLNRNLEQTRVAVQKSYLSTVENVETESFENSIREPLRQYLNIANDYSTILNTEILQGKPFDANGFISIGFKALYDNFALWNIASEQMDLLLEARITNIRFKQLWQSALILSLSLGAFLFGLHVLRQAMNPIYQVMDVTKQLAEGNLSVRAPVVYDDTIGSLSRSINSVAESFQELIGQLQWTGIQLTTSTTQIAAAAKQQEATVVQQEATTKEIAVTAREISATAKDFAKTMSEVSASAEETSELANLGKSALDQMQLIIHQLVEASSSISGKLGVLNEKAGTITGVVTTITKVADQTNLLSLNAAIEAEKAGEHGRSFAVIAREIRHLADQTASATYDIEKMVNEMVSAVSSGVMGVDKFSAEIQNAVSQVSTVSQHLAKIIEQVQMQTASFESVNQGMQAQSLGAEQINESIIQLSEVAQQTADSIRQFHRAVEQLNNAAQEMQNSVVKLKH